ncbi:MAG: hypothetical protein LBS11_03380 [Oscillospiraceae bacterium]|nr:hypothetical protein [Oscillospiraceae bacterium]
MPDTNPRSQLVSDEAELREAVATGGLVILASNISVDSTLNITNNTELSSLPIIQANGLPSQCILTRGDVTGDMIQVSGGARLTIKHITIDGGGNPGASAIIDIADGAALDVLFGALMINSHDETICADSPAIRNHGSCVIDGGLFSDNYSNMGGAVYNTGALSVHSAVFSNNGSCGDGGAIANEGICVVERAVFTRNHADGSGGAIYNADGASLDFTKTIDNIEFYNNRATIDGNDLHVRGLDDAHGLTQEYLESLARLPPQARELVTIDPVQKLTYGAAYLPEEFVLALYGPSGNTVFGSIPLDPDGYFYVPPFNVDTSVIGTQVFTLYEPLAECGRWRTDWSVIRYTFVTDGTTITARWADRPSEFRNRFIYPQRCHEPESHCALNIDPTPDCPCRNVPVPLVDNESIFLPVVRKWNW